MPRYFFHLHDGVSVMDWEGTDLPDIYTAQSQAIRTTGEMLRDLGARVWEDGDWRLEVADDRGRVLFVLHFWVEERLPAPDEAPGPAGV